MIFINLKQFFIGWLEGLDELAISFFLLSERNFKRGYLAAPRI